MTTRRHVSVGFIEKKTLFHHLVHFTRAPIYIFW